MPSRPQEHRPNDLVSRLPDLDELPRAKLDQGSHVPVVSGPDKLDRVHDDGYRVALVEAGQGEDSQWPFPSMRSRSR
jgi:hypothetical protein